MTSTSTKKPNVDEGPAPVTDRPAPGSPNLAFDPETLPDLSDLPTGGKATEGDFTSDEDLEAARDAVFELPLGADNQRELRDGGYAEGGQRPVEPQPVEPLPAEAGQHEIGAKASGES